MTPRRTRTIAGSIALVCLTLAIGQLLAHVTGRLELRLPLYLTCLVVGLVAAAVAVLAMTYGHVADAFHAGMTTAGARSKVAQLPLPLPALSRWRKLAALTAVPLAGVVLVPAMGAAQQQPRRPRPATAAAPTPDPAPLSRPAPTLRDSRAEVATAPAAQAAGSTPTCTPTPAEVQPTRAPSTTTGPTPARTRRATTPRPHRTPRHTVAPRRTVAPGPATTQAPTAADQLANKCYRVMAGHARRVTCEPLKRDRVQRKPRGPLPCWVWVPIGGTGQRETLVRTPCDTLAGQLDDVLQDGLDLLG